MNFSVFLCRKLRSCGVPVWSAGFISLKREMSRLFVPFFWCEHLFEEILHGSRRAKARAPNGNTATAQVLNLSKLYLPNADSQRHFDGLLPV